MDTRQHHIPFRNTDDRQLSTDNRQPATENLQPNSTATKIVRTACPRNCYSTCSMLVHLEGDRIRRIELDPENASTPEGPCLKGLAYVERVVSPDRILYPLRRNPAGQGFDRISWEDAFDLLVKRLGYFRERYGPQSVLYYTGSGTKGLLNAAGMEFWRMYGGCTTTYGDLCWPAGLEATRLTLGENKHSAPWDLVNARLIILWGKNSAETNIHQIVFVQKALDAGARLIVIDPRRTETADRAELLIQPRPGSDGAIALAVANLLIQTGRVNQGFVDDHVLGFEEFSRMAQEFTPEKAAEVAEVPERFIRKLADLLAEQKPATICAGFGMQRYTNSGQTMRSLIALLALTGNIGRPGAGWQFANLQSAVFDPVKDPVAFYPPKEPDGVVRISISTAKLGRDMLAAGDPELKMVWVERGNPVTQNPETNTVIQAFRHLDFRVVVEEVMTDTAREADLVLPAKTFLEQSDIVGAYWHPYIQFRQKVVDPPGEVKPETEIYRELARRLGIPPAQVDQRIPGPGEPEIEAWLEQRLKAFPGLTLERLRLGPVAAPGHQEVAFSDLMFATPSGKIEILSREASERWGRDPLPVYTEPEESVRRPSEESQKYPLYFMTPNTKNRIHSQFNHLRLIREVAENPEVTIHPRDARTRGIDAGDRVRIFNARGYLLLPARLDLGIKPGCVAVTNGWWISEGGTVDFLSLGRETDMGHGAAFHDNLVEVEKAP